MPDNQFFIIIDLYGLAWIITKLWFHVEAELDYFNLKVNFDLINLPRAGLSINGPNANFSKTPCLIIVFYYMLILYK